MRTQIAASFALIAYQANAFWASTTRYWDCGGGACGCGFGSPGKEIHCHSNALFKAPSGNPHGALFYGGAAISQQLGGGDWMASGCGKCWKLTAQGKTIVVKGTNYCPPANPSCNGQAHFDIAAPGFDSPYASISNVCAQNGEEWALHPSQICSNWPNSGCDCNQLQDPVLRAGCSNFLSLGWNNPDVDAEEVGCPTELQQAPPCWNDNGGKWPTQPPATCAAPPNAWLVLKQFEGFLV